MRNQRQQQAEREGWGICMMYFKGCASREGGGSFPLWITMGFASGFILSDSKK